MKLRELKEWVNKLPNKFLEYEVVNAEKGELTNDGEYTYRLDKPITTLDVDEDSKEILILNNEAKKT